ncbi:uncharacterized protein LOC121259227 [Juglans microcarpa x Juglans regia]|uniref:uncharacterized protein LOC121259227 n=1 Tax=Juglans microcarpa x Juglans regia TaxID=2249226 RepID=UPI001B7EF120|nr:uncharacterized protein LOC121259227 [Juglans microcarpa x Juglans regia]
MAFSVFPKQKCFILSLISIAIFCCSSGYAQDNPGQEVANALMCFNNKLIYIGCNEAYRLNPSGNIDVPPVAADLFCNGPCLAETQEVLNCIDELFSNFMFHNKATIPSVRYALNAGCSHTSQRGNFNVGQYIEGVTSNAHRLPNLISFHTFMLIIVCCFSILYDSLKYHWRK